MKLSIVTISFNQRPFLRQAIESVLEQRQEVEVEYIVVDPGSTDGSRELIAEFADRINVVVLDKDDGPADGLNAGFRHATGDVLGYLNADDYLLPGALGRVARLFEEAPATDVLYGAAFVVDERGVTLRRMWSDRFNLFLSAYGAAVVVQQSTFFRRSAYLKAGGFNAANRVAWDGELFIDMALAGARLRRTDAMLSAFRLHGESITGSGRLAELNRQHTRRMFEKIRGRAWRDSDRFVMLAARAWKHLTQPRATLERIARGPVFGRRLGAS